MQFGISGKSTGIAFKVGDDQANKASRFKEAKKISLKVNEQ
jgi:hypothetical protein